MSTIWRYVLQKNGRSHSPVFCQKEPVSARITHRTGPRKGTDPCFRPTMDQKTDPLAEKWTSPHCREQLPVEDVPAVDHLFDQIQRQVEVLTGGLEADARVAPGKREHLPGQSDFFLNDPSELLAVFATLGR